MAVGNQDDIKQILDGGRFRTAFQPIYGLDTGEVVAVEALTRFRGDVGSSPARRFEQAYAAGLGVELEIATLRHALESAVALPSGVSLSVNLSPAALLDTRTRLTLTQRQVCDVTVEITERATFAGNPDLLRHREQLREMGVQVAVDDVGVSTASVRNLRWLQPDHVKADISLTRGLESSRRARLLARYLVAWARRQRVSIIAEGVETPRQLTAWQRLGATAVQGFLLASPTDLGSALGASALSPHSLGSLKVS